MAEEEQRVEALVEEGLGHYSQGQLDLALSKWREALSLSPENIRAREYLKYVEDNRGALEESFAIAQSASGSYAAARADEPAPTAPAPAAPTTPPEPEEPSAQTIEAEPPPAVRRPAAHADEDRTITKVAKQEIELSREVVEVALPGRAAHSAATPPRDTPALVRAASQRGDDDSSFSRLAAEIVAATTAIANQGELVMEAEPPAPEAAGAPPAPAAPTSHPGPEAADAAARTFLGEGEDHTPRIDLGDLKAKVAATKRRLTNELRPVARDAKEEVPDRRPSLTVIGGGGERREEDFEPLEATPVASRLPTPARLIPSTASALEPIPDASSAEAELAASPVTPSKLGKRESTGPSAPARPAREVPAPDPAVGSGEHGVLEASKEEKRSTYIGLGPKGKEAESAPEVVPSASEELDRGQRGTPSSPGREATGEKLESMLAGARQLHEQGTFEGSLWLCERVLAIQPEHAEAKKILQANRQVLLEQYRKQLGDPRQVPVVQIPQHEIVWHKLDHRAGFLLSRIDGQLSFEDLLDVSGMNEFEAYRILAQLSSQGVIGPRR